MSTPPRSTPTLAALAILLVSASSAPSIPAEEPRETVTFQSLLDEMADRDSLARLPAPGYRQLQASSYNRKSVSRDQPEQDTGGWFADSDGVSWIREETIGGRREFVIMEHEGPGCITRVWTPFFYYGFGERVGPKIRFYLDGSDTPVIDEGFIELLTRNDWPESYGAKPPATNGLVVPAPFAAFTARAGDLYLPIPFARSCKVTLTDKAFYNIVNYRAYDEGTVVESFSRDRYQAALRRLAEVGRGLEEPAEFSSRESLRIAGELNPGESRVANLPAGSAAVRELELRWDPDEIRWNPSPLRSTILKAVFDGEESLWCPVGDFFGSPDALNPFQTHTRSVSADGRMVCRWVMPYETSAQISLENVGEQPVSVDMTVRPGDWSWDERSMHFFARWRGDDVLQGHRFVDWNFVDIRGRGVFVGDQWSVLNLTRGWWGEGDEKIYVDDSYENAKFPDHFGTGTEDYYGWAGGVNPTREDVFSHPYLANITVGSTSESNTRGFNICARMRGLDAIPFSERLVFDMEASPGVSQRNAWNLLGYSAVTFWYSRPGATSNRPPAPEAAAKAIMALDDLEKRSKSLADVDLRRIKGAIELESLKPSAKSPGLNVHSQVPAPSFKPDQLSGRAHMFIPFRKPGEFVEFRITERFEPSSYKLYVSKSYDFGIVRISVNGRVVADKLDLYSSNLALEELALGVVEPVDNAIVLRMELVEPNPRSRGPKTLAGIDYLLDVGKQP